MYFMMPLIDNYVQGMYNMYTKVDAYAYGHIFLLNIYATVLIHVFPDEVPLELHSAKTTNL